MKNICDSVLHELLFSINCVPKVSYLSWSPFLGGSPVWTHSEHLLRIFFLENWDKSTKIRRTRNESVCFAQILTKLRRDFRASVGIQKIPSCNYKLCDRRGSSNVPSKCQQFSLRPSSCSKRGRAGPSVCYLSCGGVARCLLPLVLDNLAFIIFIILVEHDLSWSSPGSAVVDFTALLATL